jgi:carboxypeptidase family protein
MRKVCLPAAVLVLLLSSASAWAQGAAIVGTVTDSSGAVLPGVTVEASSPALIEGTRVTVTNEGGLYRIIELRPGTYAVTYTLGGFQTVRRENIELTTGFTATVNAALALAPIATEITVTSQASQVDTVNTTVRQVMNQATLDALPLGQSLGAIRAMVPGAIAPAANQDVGGNQPESAQGFSINGGRAGDYQQYRDGMLTNSLVAAGNWLSSQNPATIQEVVVTTGGFSATDGTGGGIVNVVQREGGNAFSGSFFGSFANKALQSSNLTDELRARNASTQPTIRERNDTGGGFGGPLVRSKLWFFTGAHYWVTSSTQPNNYFNATQGTPYYTPDLSRPAYDLSYYGEFNQKVTWQATQKQKITATYVWERNCNCFFQINTGTLAPEAAGSNLYKPKRRIQATYTYPFSDRVLLWAGFTQDTSFVNRMTDGAATERDRSILELSTNYRYGAPGSSLILPNSWGSQDNLQANQNVTLSYMPGRHFFKVGFTTMQGIQTKDSRIADSMTYTFRNQRPQSITLWATPYNWTVRDDYLAIFAEDQWRMDRLTLNLGVRYDGLRGNIPEQRLSAGAFVPERTFAAVTNVPDFHDVNVRLGAAYDLLGRGKTALRASIARFVLFEPPGGLTQSNNPVAAMVTSATRNWSDLNGDYVPQESELGPLSNSAFGTVVRNTNFSDDVLKGWFNRQYNWQASVSVEHELAPGVSMSAGYFRTWYGNFTVTDNLLVAPGDYDQFCVTAPADPQLPGGGNRTCGLYDVRPAKFGQVDNLVVPASQFGNQTEVYNGINLAVNIKRGEYVAGGGMSTGGRVTDSCFVVDSPQALYQCHNAEAWYASTLFKFTGIAPLPQGLKTSASFQVRPSIPLLATYVAGNSDVIATLGRNLSGGATATRTIPLIAANTEFGEGWNLQLDIRLSRRFDLASKRLRFEPTLDVFNVLNASPVLTMNTQYGPQWRNATGILGARVARLGAQVRF